MIIYPELKEELDKVIEDVEKEMKEQFHSPTRILEERALFEAMEYTAFAKSKKVRAFLTMEIAKLFGVHRKEALVVASAIEFAHAYALIHDDLPELNNFSTRRGQLANHKKFGISTAILAGNALHDLAYEILSHHKNISDPEIRCELILQLSKALGAEGMAAGQVIDLKESNKKNGNYKAINKMHTLRTGKMFTFSCMAGAILGNADKEDRRKIHDYAEKIGRVFQITDDILDATGDEKLLGKNTKKHEEKQTYVTAFGLNEAKTEAEKLITQACDDLRDFKKDTTLLEELAKFLLIRTY